GIASQEFDEEARDAVKKQISAENLPIEILALEHPGQQQKDSQLDGRLEQLSRLEGLIQGRSYQLLGQRICKRHSPKMVSGPAITAAGGEAAQPANAMADCQSRGKRVARGQRRHPGLP